MGLNKQTGNMYPFVTHTWNPIRGKCPHDCLYCYMKVYPQPELHFAEKEMGTALGGGNFIFVGSSTDMWCEEVPSQWILDTLKHCREYANRYLFQSKNPARFLKFIGSFPPNTILGTTIETTAYQSPNYSKAPAPLGRAEAMIKLRVNGIPRMVSIEPIMDFDLKIMVELITLIRPEFISVGADSKGHNLPEPNRLKTKELLNSLEERTTVKIKDNLNRLLRQEMPAR
jgi:DNA repair photolyase